MYNKEKMKQKRKEINANQFSKRTTSDKSMVIDNIRGKSDQNAH